MFVVDHILRGTMFSHTDGSVLFSMNQVQNPSLSITSESTDAVDAMGVPIATFYRAKNCELTCENALFDLSLMAAQSGAIKNVASASNKLVVPAFETIDITGAETYTLKHTPKVAPTEIYKLNGDSTLGAKFTSGAAASATAFMINGVSLTPPTGLKNGEQLYVIYEYETEAAVEVVNTAKNFPKAGKLVLEVLGCDVCDQTQQLFAYLIFPNFKLSPDFDWSISTDSPHAFSGKAQQDYCDHEKKLFSIVIPEVE